MAKLEVEGKEILIKSSKGMMAVIPKEKVSWVKDQIDSGKHELVDKYVNSLTEFKHDEQKAKNGLYANIHAKRERIAAGSGERMRSPGEAGAPTAGQFKQAAKTAKAEDGVKIVPQPSDWEKFKQFNATLPSNLRDDKFQYGDKNKYDLYGMWEASNRPGSFSEVKDSELFPLQGDGTYHGFSVGNEGVWLKPKNHPTAWMEYNSTQLNPKMQDMRVIQREDGKLQYVPKAEKGMMIAPISALNSKIKTVRDSKQKAAEGMLITPPEMSDPPVKKINPPVLDKPTTQDSLDLLNNTLAVQDYYKKKNYKIDSEDSRVIYKTKDDFKKELDQSYDDLINNQLVIIPSKSGKTIGVAGKTIKDLYRKNKNKNQLYQRENFSGILDTRSPMTLYDKRIIPQSQITYKNVTNNDPLKDDIVNINTYDPIAVKPISMMTPAERKIREERYPESIPKKSKIVVPEKLEPKDASYQLSKPEIVYDRKVKMRTVPKPAQKPPPALEYPALNQNLLEKIRSLITGKNPREYWTDKQGEKHYPHLGETNPEAVKQIKMLKSNLNPLIPEEAAELRRIDSLLEMGRKERLNNIRNAKEG